MNSEDFGRRGSPEALIPGTLRVYRHFRAEEHGELFPPSAHQIMEAYNLAPQVRDRWVQDSGKSRYTSAAFRAARRPHPGFTRGIQQAECLLGFSSFLRRHEGPAPFPSCRCGFYAHYTPYGSFYTSVSFASGYIGGYFNPIPVKGVCQVSGRVIMGEKGVRAERIEILGIAPGDIRYLPDPSSAVMDAISERYQIPVFGTIAEMADSFPPDDVSELLKR